MSKKARAFSINFIITFSQKDLKKKSGLRGRTSKRHIEPRLSKNQKVAQRWPKVDPSNFRPEKAIKMHYFVDASKTIGNTVDMMTTTQEKTSWTTHYNISFQIAQSDNQETAIALQHMERLI